ncbi:MAG: hypothetical protein ABIT16_03350 [Croceibacterium sp.]
MDGRPVIRFVHEGKAAYPDVTAFRSYFQKDYLTLENSPEEVRAASDLDRAICWHIMGFYPRKLGSAISIHDYRSLSVGRLRRTKDLLKRWLNADPDLRLFQNDAMRRALGFPHDGRTFYLPMGVPQLFIDQRMSTPIKSTDFVYIGSLLPERRCELMLDSFVARFGNRRRIDLYGPPNPDLERRYRTSNTITFHGLIAQDRLPAILNAARVGVCYFPLHYPHLLQTPTKLMEYGALGMRILANEHPQSRLTAKTYGLNCEWGSTDDLFAHVPEDLMWPDNMGVDPGLMAWPAVIGASGVEPALQLAAERVFSR